MNSGAGAKGTADTAAADTSSSAGALLASADASRLSALGIASMGENAETSNGKCWFGKDGPYTGDFTNESDEPIILVLWGTDGSWVNVKKPYITSTIPPGKTRTLSFGEGVTGAWSAIYSDTKLLNGQISNTWGEFTMADPYGTVDVSREPNMKGRPMKILTPDCKSDMETCVFVCGGSEDVCMTGYQLKNCDNGSQPGANYGIHYGAPTGGCGNMKKGSHIKVSFS